MASSADDSFVLHDLKVEVVAPPGAKIYCGAKPGDYFELRGEMLFLPPGQGFSIYSLAALLPLLPAKQRPTHPNDWMSTDAEVACPDPNCPTRFRITRTGERRFSHAETTAVPLAEDADKLMPVERFSLRPGYEISRVIRGGWQLAGGHGSVDRKEAVADLAAFCEAGITTFDCADIYTGVEELIGDVPRRVCAAPRRGGAEAGQGPHEVRARPRRALPTSIARKVRATIERSLQRLRCERLDLVQFHWWDYAVPGCIEAALWLEELRARRQDRSSRRHEFRHAAHRSAGRRRRAARQHAGAVFAARRPAGERARRGLPKGAASTFSATAPSRAAF